MKSKLKRYFKKIIEIINKPEMGILPGQLAFFFVLSIIPLIALLGSLAGPLNMSTDSVISFLDGVVPKTVLEMFIPIITGKSLNVSTLIFYISAFILASNGTHSMILASNMIYDIKNRDYLSRRIKAIIMTIILVSLLVFTIIVPAFGDKILSFILSFINNNLIKSNITLIYNILKYPISLLFIYFNVKLLYTIAPDASIKSKYTNLGSLFTSIGWVITTEIYTIYVDVFAKYNLFYGSISNILILLLWVYILAFIFVMGMALNASYYKTRE